MSSGDVGEGRVQLYMQERGWRVAEGRIGARTKHFDLVFERERHVLVTQIKTSSAADGRIRYPNPDPYKCAKDLAQQAEARNGRAVMVLVQLSEEPVTTLVKRAIRDVLETTMPEPKYLTWADPFDFAAAVEWGRDKYAKGLYERGPRKGELRDRKGCGYPVGVQQFPALDSLMSDLEAGAPSPER